eukprot:4897791-Prymnesium_polylepis.3
MPAANFDEPLAALEVREVIHHGKGRANRWKVGHTRADDRLAIVQGEERCAWRTKVVGDAWRRPRALARKCVCYSATIQQKPDAFSSNEL